MNYRRSDEEMATRLFISEGICGLFIWVKTFANIEISVCSIHRVVLKVYMMYI